MSELMSLEATYMRGGTSKGVFLREADLPTDRTLWGPYLIELFGARSFRQITGMGGSDPTTSKCCIIGESSDSRYDIVYTFAQVGIGEESVRWDVNCGNLSAAVGVFAVRAGFVEQVAPETVVQVWQANTRSQMSVRVPIGPEGPRVDGTLEVGGVPGTGAGVSIDFAGTVGASMGGDVFPTGKVVDELDVPGLGVIKASIVDVGNMCVFFDPTPFGFTGREPIEDGLAMSSSWLKVQRAAQQLLGVPKVKSTPWPVSVVAPAEYRLSDGSMQSASDVDVIVRMVTQPPQPMHQAMPGTGSACVSVASAVRGTVIHDLLIASERPPATPGLLSIGHASGVIQVRVRVDDDSESPQVNEISIERTVNPIMEGKVFMRTAEINRILERMPLDAMTRSSVPAPMVAHVPAAE